MFTKTTLKALLALWMLWHLAFGLLATFAPDTGARLSGWAPEAGWSSDMMALSTQYGMVMLLLAMLYGIMALNPMRYLQMLSVAVSEQLLGIAYAVYLFNGIWNITPTQLAVQGVINLLIIGLFVMFWLKLREPPNV